MHGTLAPGRRLPDLELLDQDGRLVRLTDLARGFPLVVTFYRGWW
jgi:peroxiredoxin